jgi:hypothetical protein
MTLFQEIQGYIYMYVCIRTIFEKIINVISRSQWPRVLRPRSMASRLLRSWAQISPGHGSLSVVCVVR